MNKLKLALTSLVIVAIGGAVIYFINKPGAHEHGTGAGQHAAHGPATAVAEPEKGPNNGRILKDGDFTLELAIFERGVPPEFRAWFSQNGKPVAPADVKLVVKLIRPGNKVDTFNFAPTGDFSRGDAEVNEPHSFSYDITATHAGRTHRWQFDAPEMQTTISTKSARESGMEFEKAAPANFTETISVYGQIKLNGDKVARAVPRFGGIVREARKSHGDTVKAGEVVAVIETNQTLATIEVKAPIDGTVIERDVTAGETVAEGATLYTVADLSDVWVELNIPNRDRSRVKTGQTVTLNADDGGEPVKAKISWISPFGRSDAQTITARVVLPNTDARWRPGLHVKADIVVAEFPVSVAVKESGIQTLYSFVVVFSQHGELYQARPLELGRRSGGYVEVLKGIEAGELYVTENSFLVKADIGKSGASHDH